MLFLSLFVLSLHRLNVSELGLCQGMNIKPANDEIDWTGAERGSQPAGL